MGQRANLIIVKDHTYELYYSHWCSNTLPRDLFWGCEHAKRFIELQTKVDESGWLNDIWAEGGAVLDLDGKRLIFYGGEDLMYNVSMRNLFLSLMRKVWQDWDIQWAQEGILTLASYVGYPPEKLMTSPADDTFNLSLRPPEDRSWVDTLASVRFSEGELLLFPIHCGIDEYVPAGPDLLNKIDKSYGHRQLDVSRWTDQFPSGGFHIDIPGQSLEFKIHVDARFHRC